MQEARLHHDVFLAVGVLAQHGGVVHRQVVERQCACRQGKVRPCFLNTAQESLVESRLSQLSWLGKTSRQLSSQRPGRSHDNAAAVPMHTALTATLQC